MKKAIALLLCLIMVLSLCAACGSKEEETVAEAPAAEAAPAVAAEGGEASGEASGAMQVEYYSSAGTDYARDFEGYRQYCLDAFALDAFAPDDVKETTVAEFESMTEDNFQDGERWTALIGLGVFDDYETFLANG